MGRACHRCHRESATSSPSRLASETEPLSHVRGYAYDVRGLLTSITDPLGQVTAYAYDDAGRQVSVTDPRGVMTTYAYDSAGRQTSMTDALGGVIGFAYDAAGQQTAVTNANGKTTTFTYDALGSVLTTTDPLGRTLTNAYDVAGRLAQTTDARGVVVTYVYDGADQLTGELYPGGTVSYGYDGLGRTTSMQDVTGLTSWTYDAVSRVTAVASPQGTVAYGYNPAGQRIAMTLPGNRNVSYSYDTSGRLTSLTDWAARTTAFGYDVDGRRTSINRPNGVVSAYSYDAASRSTSIVHQSGGNTLLSFAYTYDVAGNRTAVTTAAGTESYTLDSLSRITGVTYPNGDAVGYTYDSNGNRLTKTINGGPPTTYTYDNASELTSDGTSTYTYDANGNLVTRGTDTFSWDYANRMTGAAIGGVQATYAYDGDGVRTGKTVAGTPTSYLWDRVSQCTGSCGQTCGGCATCGGKPLSLAGNPNVPLLVDDGQDSFLWADGLVEEIDAADDKFPLADALKSLRGLTDPAGNLTTAADYDVFGVVRSGSPGGVFGFTGEQLDGETGFTFLRARYLDPGVGRFTQGDTIQPNAPGTQGYNPYAYVANNPTSWVDASGHVAAPAGPAIPGPKPLPDNLAPYVVAATVLASGTLPALGNKLAGVFEYIALVLNPVTRAILHIIDGNDGGAQSRAARCANEYEDCLEPCRTSHLRSCYERCAQRYANCLAGRENY